MGEVRKITKKWQSRPTVEGAGVHLRRAFGYDQAPQLDPFLLLDDFHSTDPAEYLPGFPWHPHRGIETITYVLEGNVEHGDSMGNRGLISPGDVQWMTAGSGVIHQEMPKGNISGVMWGFQLWANLPASHKMMEPRYRDVKAAQIPEADRDGARIKIICGSVDGVRGPVQDIVTDPEYLDVTLSPGGRFVHPVPRGHNVFAYVIGGVGHFDDERDPYAHEVVGANYYDFDRQCACGPETVVLFGDGDSVAVTAEEERSLRFLLASGKPIGEPVAWYGPIVMNTREELKTAFEEFRKGTFVKH
ncbi:MAG: pirin family protein [Syntrophobacteraceae bacterium]